MSADQLRAAASLLRDRAEAATPGPWVADDGEVCHYSTAMRSGWLVSHPPKVADAAHIAALHPAVALAMADWLDVVAARNEALLSSFTEGSRSGAVVAAANTLGWSEALALATAYLGTP